jgi:hypothetical protein
MSFRMTKSFAAIRTTRDFFEHPVGNTGIWGLGMKPPHKASVPLFDQIVSKQLVSKNQFSMALCGASGHLWLGEPRQQYLGTLMYEALLPSPHYTVRMREILIDGHSVNVPLDPRAIIDSGSTFLVLPPRPFRAVIASLRAAMPGVDAVRHTPSLGPNFQAIWNQFCIHTDPSLWPPLSIALENTTINVFGRDYLNKQVSDFCCSPPLSLQTNYFFLAVASLTLRATSFVSASA